MSKKKKKSGAKKPLSKTSKKKKASKKKASKAAAPRAVKKGATKKKGKVAKKGAKKKKGTKKTAKRETGGLSVNQIKVLKALKNTVVGQRELTRVQLRESTGINKKGICAKLLGAATQEGMGVGGKQSLAGQGLITINQYEDSRRLHMAITSKGKAKLAQADK